MEMAHMTPWKNCLVMPWHRNNCLEIKVHRYCADLRRQWLLRRRVYHAYIRQFLRPSLIQSFSGGDIKLSHIHHLSYAAWLGLSFDEL